MVEVFISYSRKDMNFVRELHSSLIDQDRDTWVDWQDILPTADWLREIYGAIEAADTFIFVISPDSITSPVCNLEIDHATRHNKRLVPIVRLQVDENTAFAAIAARIIDETTKDALAGR